MRSSSFGLVLLFLSVAMANSQQTIRVSVATDGSEGNGDSDFGGNISGSGRFVRCTGRRLASSRRGGSAARTASRALPWRTLRTGAFTARITSARKIRRSRAQHKNKSSRFNLRRTPCGYNSCPLMICGS